MCAEFTYEDLRSYTNGFCEELCIGKFQFGKLYRGLRKTCHVDYTPKKRIMIQNWEYHHVVVKMYEDPSIYKVCPGDTRERITDEDRFLNNHFCKSDYSIHYPCLPKLIGTWSEGERGACVYKLKPLDALDKLIPKDCFSWLQRIKVAFGLAALLEFLHRPYYCYLIRNIDAAHVMVDEDHNPVLTDFSMITGGILREKRDVLNQYVHGCYGYIDPSLVQSGWSEKCDVFAYGVVLLGLITKRVYTNKDETNHASFVYELANSEYKSGNKSSMVHQSLERGPSFNSVDGIQITELALKCVDCNPQKRPTMDQVLRCLLKLCICNDEADSLGIELTLKGYYPEFQKDAPSGLLSKPMKNDWFSHDGERRPTITRSVKEHKMMRIYSSEDLSFYTNGFSEENMIGKFQFGKIYRGEMEGQKVTVKVWEDFIPKYEGHIGRQRANEDRLRDELVLLQHPDFISHPNLVNLIGYCHEDKCLGVVYDLAPLDSVRNLISKDTFTWSQRIQVAFGFAYLLSFLHSTGDYSSQYAVANIADTHIMLDQDMNAKLIDFGALTGQILPGLMSVVDDCFGYVDPYFRRNGEVGECGDIFSFGTLLVSLISKKVCSDDEIERLKAPIYYWAQSEFEAKMSIPGYNKSEFSLVHESLQQDPAFCSSDGRTLTKLAMVCLREDFENRPNMKKVVKALSRLHIVKNGLCQCMIPHSIPNLACVWSVSEHGMCYISK